MTRELLFDCLQGNPLSVAAAFQTEQWLPSSWHSRRIILQVDFNHHISACVWCILDTVYVIYNWHPWDIDIPASSPQLVRQRPWYVLSCLWDGACKNITLLLNRKISPCSDGSRFPLGIWVVLYYMLYDMWHCFVKYFGHFCNVCLRLLRCKFHIM